MTCVLQTINFQSYSQFNHFNHFSHAREKERATWSVYQQFHLAVKSNNQSYDLLLPTAISSYMFKSPDSESEAHTADMSTFLSVQSMQCLSYPPTLVSIYVGEPYSLCIFLSYVYREMNLVTAHRHWMLRGSGLLLDSYQTSDLLVPRWLRHRVSFLAVTLRCNISNCGESADYD